MKRNTTIDPGIEALSEFGALAHYDETWLVDRRDYITECGAPMSDGEIWRVNYHDRTTALVVADGKEAQDSEFPVGGNHEEKASSRFDGMSAEIWMRK